MRTINLLGKAFRFIADWLDPPPVSWISITAPPLKLYAGGVTIVPNWSIRGLAEVANQTNDPPRDR